MKRYNRLHEITIKKTVILLIEKPIFCQNMGKTGLLRSYDQEISGFIDRNPGRDVKVRPRGARRNPEKDIGRVQRDLKRCREISRDAERDAERDVDIFIVCRVKPDRHHRRQISQASGSQQSTRATPGLAPLAECLKPESR